MTGPEPRDWSDNDWADRAFVDYELATHEKKALDQIEKNIALDLYTDPKSCFKHMEFLEELANELRAVVANEHSQGKANWDIEQAIKDIKELYTRLNACYIKLRRK